MNESGVGLTETLIGLAVGAIVMLGLARLSMSVSTQNQDMQTQSLIDTLHGSALHFVRSMEQVRQITGVTSNSGLAACLSRKGTGCQSYAGSEAAFNDAAGDLNSRFGLQSKCGGVSEVCSIKRTTFYRFACSRSTTCESLEIRIVTAFDPPSSSDRRRLVDRTATIQIPGLVLVSRGLIDFSCAAFGKIISGIDYENLRAVCMPYTGTNQSPNAQPLRSFSDRAPTPLWQTGEDHSCPAGGFTRVGLFAGQSSCWSPGATPPSPPPPPPAQCAGGLFACWDVHNWDEDKFGP